MFNFRMYFTLITILITVCYINNIIILQHVTLFALFTLSFLKYFTLFTLSFKVFKSLPVSIDSEKAAPMESPSIKLCMPSPKMIIQATVAILLLPPMSRDFTSLTVGLLAGCGLAMRDSCLIVEQRKKIFSSFSSVWTVLSSKKSVKQK